MIVQALVLLLSSFVPSSDEVGQRAGQGRRIARPAVVLPERARVDAVNRALEERLLELLPSLMRETGVDLWLIINREYAEDPLYLTMVPEPVFAARRTTMLLFHDRGEEEGVSLLTVNRYPLRPPFEAAWQGGDLDEQWAALGEILAELDPRQIGVNTSRDWPVADGLTAGLRARLDEVLSDELRGRVVSAEKLAVRWAETRTALEVELFGHAVAIARGVIAEAFSNDVITPGVTTSTDVAWWLRQRFTDLGLPIWFMPYVNVQRPDWNREDGDAPFLGRNDVVIRRGDVLHTDVGIRYLRLNTDTQEMGYVCRVGEDDVPAGLRRAMEIGNRWQDLLTGSFVAGRTGNQILAATRAAAEKEGIVCSVYTHPVGFFGHAPGPTIGMWDNQGETPIRGDWPLHAMTCYAIEGNVRVPVPEWGGADVQVKLEQDAWFDGERVTYLAGRQTEWHLVR